jgi:hypothetical protein
MVTTIKENNTIKVLEVNDGKRIEKTVKLTEKYGVKTFTFNKKQYATLQTENSSNYYVVKLTDRVKDILKKYSKKEKQTWSDLEYKLNEIVNFYKEYEAETDSVRLGSSNFSATKYGFIKIEEDITYRSGYFNEYVKIGVKVGSNIKCEELRDELKALCITFSGKLRYNNSESVPSFHYKCGSAYDIIGIG